MLHIKFSNKYGETSEESIEQYSKKLGYILPKDYREFLLKHNGGSPTHKTVSVFKERERLESTVIHFFYGLFEQPSWGSLTNNIKSKQHFLPSSCIPIASDMLGNAFLLELDKKKYGQVLFWNHEFTSGENGYENTTFIAESFSAFIDSLKEVQEEESLTKKFVPPSDYVAIIEKMYKRTSITNAIIFWIAAIWGILLGRGFLWAIDLPYYHPISIVSGICVVGGMSVYSYNNLRFKNHPLFQAVRPGSSELSEFFEKITVVKQSHIPIENRTILFILKNNKRYEVNLGKHHNFVLNRLRVAFPKAYFNPNKKV